MVEVLAGLDSALKAVDFISGAFRKGRDFVAEKDDLKEQLADLKDNLLTLKQEALAQREANLDLVERNQILTRRLEAFRAFEVASKDYTPRKVEPGTTLIVRVDDFDRPIQGVTSYCIKCYGEHEIQPLQFKVREGQHDTYECHKCSSAFKVENGRESLSIVAFSESKFDGSW